MLSGILMSSSRPAGVWVYVAVLIGTIAWAIHEAGLDGWALLPRLVAPLVLGVWIFSRWVAGRLLKAPGHGQIAGHSHVRAVSWGGMLACMVLIGLVFAAGYRITDMRYARADDTSGWTTAMPAPAERVTSHRMV